MKALVYLGPGKKAVEERPKRSNTSQRPVEPVREVSTGDNVGDVNQRHGRSGKHDNA